MHAVSVSSSVLRSSALGRGWVPRKGIIKGGPCDGFCNVDSHNLRNGGVPNSTMANNKMKRYTCGGGTGWFCVNT